MLPFTVLDRATISVFYARLTTYASRAFYTSNNGLNYRYKLHFEAICGCHRAR